MTREQKQKIACTLRQEGWTQDRITQMLGIGQTTALRWLGECSQTGKPTQPSKIRGKDGRAYPPTKAPKSAKPQTEKTDTAKHGSTSPTPSGNSIDTGIDAELAEGMQRQGAVPGWSITPDGPSSEDVSVEPEATDFPRHNDFQWVGCPPGQHAGELTGSQSRLMSKHELNTIGGQP